MAPNLEGVTTQSLANPVVQPSDAQLLEQTTIASLRSTQHLDINGNPISKYSDFLLNRMNANNFPADPDLSNPTRPCLERPLDTIRSFEKAIDAGYKRRSSMMRGGASSMSSFNYFYDHQTDIQPQNHTSNLNSTKAGATADTVSCIIFPLSAYSSH